MLDRALDKVCPKKIKKLGVKANLWYNNDLKRLADRIKKAYKIKTAKGYWENPNSFIKKTG